MNKCLDDMTNGQQFSTRVERVGAKWKASVKNANIPVQPVWADSSFGATSELNKRLDEWVMTGYKDEGSVDQS